MSLFIPPDYFRELQHGEIFPGAARPLEVDLGCGDGSFFASMARQFPERDFLAIERMRGRVAKSCRKVAAAGLSNARVMRLESSYAVASLLPTAGVSRVHLLCPDPWPKNKHEARRLVNQDEFLDGLERVLVCGGEFLLKTDDRIYFENAVQNLSNRAAFFRLDWPADAFFYSVTDFEQYWLGLGREIFRARWRRLERQPALHGAMTHGAVGEIKAAA